VRIIGLTGGTGSGKSAAGRRFAEAGIPVLDADAIGHALIAPGGAAEAAVRAAFGDAILSGGIIDREKLGARVFGDASARAQLNAIVHPMLAAEVAQRCMELAAKGHEVVILDAALLGENGVREAFLSGLILVLAPDALRRERLIRQRGMDAARAEAQIRSQRPPEEKRGLADWVILNDGSMEALNRRVDEIVRELRDAVV
jgi:dephospho-CoA kinase